MRPGTRYSGDYFLVSASALREGGFFHAVREFTNGKRHREPSRQGHS